MSYIDLAKKPSQLSDAAKEPSGPVLPYYPGMHLDMPATPDIKLNTVIEAKVKLKLTGVRTDKYSGKTNTCLDFDVMAIDLGAAPAGKKNSAQEDLAEAMQGDMDEMDKD